VSTLDELTTGAFREVLADPAKLDVNRVSRVLICSGQVYYDLAAAREERKITDIAILRLEQIYPFAADQVRDAIESYPETAEVVWVQEEPRNMGPFFYVMPRLAQIAHARGLSIRSVKRSASASPATGSAKAHELEQKTLLSLAFTTTAAH
jgi:2-oxoglutarate dehydrogenase complex dehydrogenase (E1) component-like enzyme